METFLKGDVVVIPFPYSDISNAKRRPAFVLSVFPKNELILCQITSQPYKDDFGVMNKDSDFLSGSLQRKSYTQLNRIFTADAKIIIYKAGIKKSKKVDEIIQKIITMLMK